MVWGRPQAREKALGTSLQTKDFSHKCESKDISVSIVTLIRRHLSKGQSATGAWPNFIHGHARIKEAASLLAHLENFSPAKFFEFVVCNPF